jgi:hypothetical protein
LNASAVTVNVLVGVALLAVLIKPNPDTWPLLLILTAYLPSMPLIELVFVLMFVVLLPTVVDSDVTLDDKEDTSPSKVETLDVSVVTALEFAAMSLSALVKSVCKDVIAVAFELMLPSALVTRVSKPDTAVAFAVTSPSNVVKSDCNVVTSVCKDTVSSVTWPNVYSVPSAAVYFT